MPNQDHALSSFVFVIFTGDAARPKELFARLRP
jgi:hypothetical protein